MSAAVSNPMPALPALGAPSRLSAAFWLALAAEAALTLAVVWAVTHEPTTRVSPRPVEQVRLVQLPKPVEKPKPTPEVKHPEPVPRRITYHPRPVALPPPPVALPPPIALPPSPIAAPAPTPKPPPKPQPAVSAGEKASYLGAIRAAIQQAVQFPADARMLRQDGKVRVKFQLRDGVISNVQITTPGRMKSFNSNALLAVHDASIPNPPKALAHHVFTLVLWVKFHLHRSL
jgi:protein TonB